MARHNREGRGTDQRGFEYTVNYQPDWLRHVKVTRKLKSGRQSTMTLFRNPADRQEAKPGKKVRTRITSTDQGLDFEVVIRDRGHGVSKFRVAYEVSVPGGKGNRTEEVEFTVENELPPPGSGR